MVSTRVCGTLSGSSNLLDRPNMLDFLNTKVSTLVGIIVLLLVTGVVGAMIYYQMYQIMTIRYEPISFLPVLLSHSFPFCS